MSGVLFPREAGRLIAETSKDVTVKQPGVEKIASLILGEARCGRFGQNTWSDHELNPTSADRAAVEWMFVVDVLNFSFWTPDGCRPYTVTYRDKTYTGYWALCATINRALDEGLPITNPDYYASLSLADFKKIFRSDSDAGIPLLKERHEALTEAGKLLLKKFRGSFVNCIKECDGSAQKLLKLIVQNFPSFRDEADFNGKRVGLYKRAQIVIGDIWAACDGKGLGEFNDISSLTMFPDYRIPQVLAYYGALEYSDFLSAKLRKDNILRNGERLEVEIRGCSIWAVELIVDEVKKLLAKESGLEGISCCAVNVDHFLWDHREACSEDMKNTPYHKTRSIYY